MNQGQGDNTMNLPIIGQGHSFNPLSAKVKSSHIAIFGTTVNVLHVSDQRSRPAPVFSCHHWSLNRLWLNNIAGHRSDVRRPTKLFGQWAEVIIRIWLPPLTGVVFVSRIYRSMIAETPSAAL